MFKRNFYTKYPMQFFNADDGSGSGAGAGSDEGSGAGSGEGAGEGSGTGGEKTFTQAELDALIKDRLAREKKKYEGVDVEEYKRFKADAQKKADDEKTELQKLQEKLSETEKTSKSVMQQANARLIKAEFKVLAKELGVEYVDDAFKLADLSGIKVNENGEVEGIKEIVEALVAEKPFLVKNKGGTGKIDNKSKGDKGSTDDKGSIGKFLAQQRKDSIKAQEEGSKNYFKNNY